MQPPKELHQVRLRSVGVSSQRQAERALGLQRRHTAVRARGRVKIAKRALAVVSMNVMCDVSLINKTPVHMAAIRTRALVLVTRILERWS